MNKKFYITALAGIGIFVSVKAAASSEPATVETVPAARVSKSYHFDSAKVLKYDDNPDIIIVDGKLKQDDFDFVLNRSFKNELQVNIDKETISRMSGN